MRPRCGIRQNASCSGWLFVLRNCPARSSAATNNGGRYSGSRRRIVRVARRTREDRRTATSTYSLASHPDVVKRSSTVPGIGARGRSRHKVGSGCSAHQPCFRPHQRDCPTRWNGRPISQAASRIWSISSRHRLMAVFSIARSAAVFQRRASTPAPSGWIALDLEHQSEPKGVISVESARPCGSYRAWCVD